MRTAGQIPTSEAQAIIARCTRDGRTLWAHVAQQMGGCVESVRSQYDPTFLKAQEPQA